MVTRGGDDTIIPPDSDMSKKAKMKTTRLNYFAPPRPPTRRGEPLGRNQGNSSRRGVGGGSSFHATNNYGSRRRSNFEEAVANLQQQQQQQQQQLKPDQGSHDEKVKLDSKKAMHNYTTEEGEHLAPMPPGQDEGEGVPQIRNWLSDMGGKKNADPLDAVPSVPPPPQLEYDTSGRIIKSKSNNQLAAAIGGGAPGAYSAGPPGMDEEYRNTPENYGQLGVIGRGSVKSSTKSQKKEEDDSKEFRKSSTQGRDDVKGGRVVVEGTLEEETSRPVWWKRKPVILAILLVIIIAIVVPIVIVLQSNSSSNPEANEQQPEQESNEDPIDEEWVPLVPDMTNATLAALEDPFSQQSQSYEWISEDPDWDTYQNWRKQQRFAMMCYYYAFASDSGGGVGYRFAPRYSTHECDWLLSFNACGDNDSGEINRIGLLSFVGIRFKGTMPPEIAFLSNLEAIEFLGGEIDMIPLEDLFPLDTINILPPIKSLRFDQSRLRGSIPSTLGLFTSLTSLELFDTSLESTIPSQLGLLYNLTTLSLSSNGLTGSIPEEIGQLPFLIYVDIKNNPDLEPPIPSGFCSGNRTPFETLETDWCSTAAECCGS